MNYNGYSFKKDFAEVVGAFESRGCELQIKEEEYINTKQKLPYICNKHKEKGVQYAKYDNFRISTIGCRYCSYEIRGKKHRIDYSVIEKAFLDRGYKLLSERKDYNGNTTKLEFICPKHEVKGVQGITWADFNSGCGCYHCGREKVAEAKWKYTLEFWQEKFDERGYKLLSKTYEGTSSKVDYVCEKHPEETQSIKISNFYFLGQGCSFCWEERRPRGENHPSWKGTTPEYERIRKSKEYLAWKVAVFRRDKHTCQCCGSRKGDKLRAHHINSFVSYPDLRFEVSNGITLCENCHENKIPGSLHHTYGCHNVTESQLNEYLVMRKESLKASSQ